MWRVRIDDPTVHAAEQAGGSGKLTAPMPGAIVVVHIKPGQEVEKNQPLLVLEAMKMEHTVRAPAAGRVEAVRVSAGDQVVDGAELIVLDLVGT
jgi:3-methylcrotonyl-CoA carboxylase alpha subunit